MNGEVTFRRAVIGGFNREDVMNYISSVATSNNEQQKLRVSLREAQATIEKLQTELEAKNDDLTTVVQADSEKEELRVSLAKSEEAAAALQAEVDELKLKLQKYESKTSEMDETAEKLMRDSMTYADRYVESANLMAANVRKETLAKVKDADAKVEIMMEKAEAFCKETAEFESLIKFFRSQLKDVEKTFE